MNLYCHRFSQNANQKFRVFLNNVVKSYCLILKNNFSVKTNKKVLLQWCVIFALNKLVKSCYLILKNSFSVKTDEMVLFHVKKATLLQCMWCVILVVN